MQQFDSQNPNSVSQQEAQEILATWANRRQAQGVDPGVNSVSALASGLGVSEEEVRQMLEDIRVHKRSQEIATGIISHQQRERKRSDVSAAIIAAVIFVVVGLAIALFVFARPVPVSRVDERSKIVDDNIPPQVPTSPPQTALSNSYSIEADGSVTHTSPLHGITHIEPGSYMHSEGSGNAQLAGQAAIDEINTRIANGQKIVTELQSKSELSTKEQAELDYWNGDQGELKTLQQGLKVIGNEPTP